MSFKFEKGDLVKIVRLPTLKDSYPFWAKNENTIGQIYIQNLKSSIGKVFKIHNYNSYQNTGNYYISDDGSFGVPEFILKIVKRTKNRSKWKEVDWTQ